MGERFNSEWMKQPMHNELYDSLDHPERVFDSDRLGAERQHRQFNEDARGIWRSENETVAVVAIESHLGSSKPSIQIVWKDKPHPTMLELIPIGGKGLEAGIFGYKGVYGRANLTDGDEWKLLNGDAIEDVFGVPNATKVVIKPTIDRWAVGKDELSADENTVTMFMGIGFLMLGEQWMYIGMHEAGHLPNTDSEHEAWTIAGREYAKRHKPFKKKIVKGKDTGQFDILRDPYSGDILHPTIGEVISYGLIFQLIGEGNIPSRWRNNARQIMNDRAEIIKRAHQAYASFMQ